MTQQIRRIYEITYGADTKYLDNGKSFKISKSSRAVSHVCQIIWIAIYSASNVHYIDTKWKLHVIAFSDKLKTIQENWGGNIIHPSAWITCICCNK